MDWLNNNPFWPGPGIPYFTGNLPGPFFYFLLIPPLLLNNPYLSLILYTLAWLSLTFTIAFYFVKKITKTNLSPVLFLVLLWTSHFFCEIFLSLQLNSLFSVMFHLGLMICLFEWKEKKNDIYLIFAGLLMGLGIQIHHSILFHFITILTFLITDERVLKNQFQWKYLMAFISVFLIPQIPYLSVMFSEDSHLYIRNYDPEQMKWLMDQFGSHPFRPLKQIFISLDVYNKEGLVRLLLILSLGVLSYTYKNIKTEKYFVDESVWTIFLIALFPILLSFPFVNYDLNSFFYFLFVLIGFIKWYDNFWPQKESLRQTLFLIMGLLFIGNRILFSNINLRDLIDIFGTSILSAFFLVSIPIILCFVFDRHYLKLSKTRYFLSMSVVLVTVYSVLGLSFMDRGVYLQRNKLKQALKYVYQETGWNDNEAMKKIFQFGFKSKLDFLFYYRLAQEEIGPIDKEDGMDNKGYFIIYSKNENFKKHSRIQNWFLNADFPDEIKEEIKKNTLIIQSPNEIRKSAWIIPYVIKKHSLFPWGFHNMGGTDYKEPDWSKNICYFSSLIKDKNKFYLCYILYNYVGEKISFLINFSKIKNKSVLEVKITGYPLTITSAEQKDFHFIKDIFIYFSCGTNKEKIKIISRMGHNVDKSDHFKSLFAPLEIKYPIKCKNVNHIKNVTVTFHHKIGYKEIKPVVFSYPPEIQ